MENHKEPHQGTLEGLKKDVQTLRKFDTAWGEIIDNACDIIDDCINFRDKK